tara:strand:- start:576 stop:893 length:318 start_codon:yes stop_codon:yes gene_type:complete
LALAARLVLARTKLELSGEIHLRERSSLRMEEVAARGYRQAAMVVAVVAHCLQEPRVLRAYLALRAFLTAVPVSRTKAAPRTRPAAPGTSLFGMAEVAAWLGQTP